MKANGTPHPIGTDHGVIPGLPGTTDLQGGDAAVPQARLAQLYREIDIFRVECAALLQALQALLRHIECGGEQTDASPHRLSVCGIAVNDPYFEADVRHARTVASDESAAAAVRSSRVERADVTPRA